MWLPKTPGRVGTKYEIWIFSAWHMLNDIENNNFRFYYNGIYFSTPQHLGTVYILSS
jgi:hypothetical protein